MSSKKSKLDLLVRVRYSNPLPPPPFPPKSLQVQTHPSRYSRLEFTSQLANETPLPMVVDAECGMPIDLALWDGLWDYGDAEDLDLNPDPNNLPELDPKDAFLVSDLNSGYTNGASASKSTPAVNVSWLRKTEYISSTNVNRNLAAQDIKQNDEEPIDVSRSAQIADIEASFRDRTDLAALRHPNKPHVRAVESYEVLPDAGIWANAYDLVKFSERPGERPLDQLDLRLDCAVIRPVMGEDDESFLSYYLTKEDDEALAYNATRRNPHSNKPLKPKTLDAIMEDDDEENPDEILGTFNFIRDYETVKVDTDVPNEFLLVLDDGDSTAEGAIDRPKGAYYKNIERKYVLKKKRQNKNDDYSVRWDIIHLTHAPFSEEQEQEREEALAEVNDPMYMNVAQMEVDEDVDADGEVDGDVHQLDAVGADEGVGGELSVHLPA